MKNIFSEEAKFRYMLRVEAELARAHAEVGNISKEDAQAIEEAVNSQKIKIERMREIEEETRHDIMALIKSISEQCGKSGRFVHLGATSNDIIDTATAMQLQEAITLILAGLADLRKALRDSAVKYRDTIMLGRTHGQSAVPITFGLKMAVFTKAVDRHIRRLELAKEHACVGKMMGAVGTGAALGEHAMQIQDIVMRRLGIAADEASTQVIGRDRYAELVCVLSLIATSCEQFATEIRNLQRSEIDEVAEAFDEKKQVGSSTMAHKRNPIVAENICALARIVRGFMIPSIENMVLWHERDLTNSASERFTLSHTIILTDDIVQKSATLFRNLVVKKESMLTNMARAGDTVMAESVIMTLARKGMDRQDAHELVRQLSLASTRGGEPFREALKKNKDVLKLMTPDEIDTSLDHASYLGSAHKIIDSLEN